MGFQHLSHLILPGQGLLGLGHHLLKILIGLRKTLLVVLSQGLLKILLLAVEGRHQLVQKLLGFIKPLLADQFTHRLHQRRKRNLLLLLLRGLGILRIQPLLGLLLFGEAFIHPLFQLLHHLHQCFHIGVFRVALHLLQPLLQLLEILENILAFLKGVFHVLLLEQITQPVPHLTDHLVFLLQYPLLLDQDDIAGCLCRFPGNRSQNQDGQ